MTKGSGKDKEAAINKKKFKSRICYFSYCYYYGCSMFHVFDPKKPQIR